MLNHEPNKKSLEKIHALAPLNLTKVTRQEILAYFNNSWQLTETLFSSLKHPEVFYREPYHRLRHPLIFYYCHPAVLYINKLRLAKLLEDPIDPDIEVRFQSGVDEMTWDNTLEDLGELPSLEAIREYRQTVYDVVVDIIQEHSALENPITLENPAWAILMGIEHERIHLETSSVLIRELPLELVQQPAQWPKPFPSKQTTTTLANPWRNCATQTVNIGKPLTSPTYGWDNEYGERQIEVARFKAQQQLVSNGEFLAFVKDGGYQNQALWSEEGWRWKSFNNTKIPHFWVPCGPDGLHEYQLRLCFSQIDLPMNFPVEVNYHEAKAYAAWKTQQDGAKIPYRLLTEAEHHCLRRCGDNVTDANIGLTWGSSCPVDQYKFASGFYDVFGNVWQWSEELFQPLPGFVAHPLYLDFSTPCFDGMHNMIFGGSFASTGDMAGEYARFHFRRHFFQHAGFRLAQGDSAVLNKYETDQLLEQYLILHYPDIQRLPYADLLGNVQTGFEFAQVCARIAQNYAQQLNLACNRALDIGCAVGGCSFELAKTFNQVLGIDASQRFIQTAQVMQQASKVEFGGKIYEIDPTIDRNRVEFQVADASLIVKNTQMGSFDLLIVANLLCRLERPQEFLLDLCNGNLMTENGLLLLTTPFSWDEKYTPAANWLGIEQVEQVLAPAFTRVLKTEIPLLIREHARKFELVVPQLTLWRKR